MTAAMTEMYNKTSMPRWITPVRICITTPMKSHLEIDDAKEGAQAPSSRALAAAE
jgi:hypothetical protein